jgi:triosephosphate isomerase (TIM)
MRKKIVAGNWKMNKTLAEGVALAKEVEASIAGFEPKCKVIIATPAIHLTEVSKVLKKVELSAQTVATEASGAYTGEVSASMVASTGAKYTLVGHSERRTYYGETNAILSKKVKLALENNLEVIFCVGEVLEERESNKHFDVVKEQMEKGVFDLDAKQFAKIIVAYEPVWAIGTGKTASSDQAQEIHAYIRSLIAAKYGATLADDTTILYGGSCKASNAAELFSKPDVDGGLIGGASLVASDFLGIIQGF